VALRGSAASAFGAGFGGSVWALVAEGQAAAFLERWKTDYLSNFPQHQAASEFFFTKAGPGATRLS